MNKRTPAFGRVVLLGGSSEIGLAILEHTISPNATICLVGRSSDRQTVAAQHLRSRGHEVSEVPYDTSMTPEQTGEVLRRATRSPTGSCGPIDAVIMAIGTMGEQLGPEAILTTNLVGPASLILGSQRILASQGSGTLIVLSSAAAIRPRESILFYAMAKQGLDTLVRTTTESMAAAGVRTLLVRPGFVSTAMTAHLTPALLASTATSVGLQVAKALPGRKSILWVPGAMRWVVLGLRLLPRSVLPASLR